MEYLVTGGAGFIGSNIVKALIGRGYSVGVVDNFSTGDAGNLAFPATILRSVDSLPSTLRGIFHLGMPSSTPMYREDRALVHKTLKGAVNLWELAKQRKLRVVFASSSSLYNGNPIPWHEDMPIFVTDFYTEVRYWLERLSTLYYDFYGVESIGLRLFSVYGIGEEAKGKYANLITQLLWARRDKSRFPIYGDGSQSRDFIYINDVVTAFLLAMESKIPHGFFNVGTGIAHSVNDIIKILGVEVDYIENPLKNYVEQTLADPRKAEEQLGFKARHSLGEGLEILNGYYSSSYKK
jgi:UDP-glucose 4-epimerase